MLYKPVSPESQQQRWSRCRWQRALCRPLPPQYRRWRRWCWCGSSCWPSALDSLGSPYTPGIKDLIWRCCEVQIRKKEREGTEGIQKRLRGQVTRNLIFYSVCGTHPATMQQYDSSCVRRKKKHKKSKTVIAVYRQGSRVGYNSPAVAAWHNCI